jgi:hypothetical protein
VRQHFSIDAPRMAVRSRLPWPWRAVAGACLLVVVAGMWWWGFDFGQIFGSFNRKEIEARIVALEERGGPAQETPGSRQDVQQSRLADRWQASLSGGLELSTENSRSAKLAFCRSSSPTRTSGQTSIQLSVGASARMPGVHLLLVPGALKDEFVGQVTLRDRQPVATGVRRPPDHLLCR